MSTDRKASRQTLNLLATLLEQPRQWRHGYDLAQDTGLKSGTLYPILMRLADRALLESRWQETSERGRPPRHMYRLTVSGLDYAKEQITQFGTDAGLDAALGSHT
jgi:DNA-binding PadR family transcriptional regulator